jgi:hypothetical protein
VKIETSTFSVDYFDEKSVVLKGIMRLVSPMEYMSVFDELYRQIDLTPHYTIDLSKLEYLNSSGITALSRIVLYAREHAKKLKFICGNTIAWQRKTMNGLMRLWDELQVDWQQNG